MDQQVNTTVPPQMTYFAAMPNNAPTSSYPPNPQPAPNPTTPSCPQLQLIPAGQYFQLYPDRQGRVANLTNQFSDMALDAQQRGRPFQPRRYRSQSAQPTSRVFLNPRYRSNSRQRRPPSLTRSVTAGQLYRGVFMTDVPAARSVLFTDEKWHLTISLTPNYDYLRARTNFFTAPVTQYVPGDADFTAAVTQAAATLVESLDESTLPKGAWQPDAAIIDLIKEKPRSRQPAVRAPPPPQVNVLVPRRQRRFGGPQPRPMFRLLGGDDPVPLLLRTLFAVLLWLFIPVSADFVTVNDCPTFSKGVRINCYLPHFPATSPRPMPQAAMLYYDEKLVYGPYSSVAGRVWLPKSDAVQIDTSITGTAPKASCPKGPQSNLGFVRSGGEMYLLGGSCTAYPAPYKAPGCSTECAYVSNTIQCTANNATCPRPTGDYAEYLLPSSAVAVKETNGKYFLEPTPKGGRLTSSLCLTVTDRVEWAPCDSGTVYYLPAELSLGDAVTTGPEAFVGNYALLSLDGWYEDAIIGDYTLRLRGPIAVVLRSDTGTATSIKVHTQGLGDTTVDIPGDVPKFGDPPAGQHICELGREFIWVGTDLRPDDMKMCQPLVYNAEKKLITRYYDAPVDLIVSPATTLGVAFQNRMVYRLTCDKQECKLPGDIWGVGTAVTKGVTLDLGEVRGADCASNRLYCTSTRMAVVAWLPIIPMIALVISSFFVSTEMSYRLTAALMVWVLTVPPSSAKTWRVAIYVVLAAGATALAVTFRLSFVRKPGVFMALVVYALLLHANGVFAEVCTGVKCERHSLCVTCTFDPMQWCQPSPPVTCPPNQYNLAPAFSNVTHCVPFRRYYKVIAQDYWRWARASPAGQLCAISDTVLSAMVGPYFGYYENGRFSLPSAAVQTAGVGLWTVLPAIATRYFYGVRERALRWVLMLMLGAAVLLAAIRRQIALVCILMLALLTEYASIAAAEDIALPAAVGACVTSQVTSTTGRTSPVFICVSKREHQLKLHHTFDSVDCALNVAYSAHCAVRYGDNPCQAEMAAMNDHIRRERPTEPLWQSCLSVYHKDCKACHRDYLARPCWTVPEQNMRNYFYRMTQPPDSSEVNIYEYTGMIDRLVITVNGTEVDFDGNRLWTQDGRIAELTASALPLQLPVSQLLRFEGSWYVPAVKSALYDPNGIYACLRNRNTKTLSYDDNRIRYSLQADLQVPVPQRLKAKFASGSLDAVPFVNYMSHGCTPEISGSNVTLKGCQSGIVTLRLTGDWGPIFTQEAKVNHIKSLPMSCLDTMDYAPVRFEVVATMAGRLTMRFEPDQCWPKVVNVQDGSNVFQVSCRRTDQSIRAIAGDIVTTFSITCAETTDIDRNRYELLELSPNHSVSLIDAAANALQMWRDRNLRWIYVGISIFVTLIFFPLLLFLLGKIKAVRQALLLPSTYAEAMSASKSPQPLTRITIKGLRKKPKAI
nr:TPA_asm: hypothetical protein [Psilosi virus]